MKHCLPTTIATALLAVSPAPAEEAPSIPELDGARVTLPYRELKSLWEASIQNLRSREQHSRDKSPVKSVTSAAEYRVTTSEKNTQIDADYQIDLLTDSWHTIGLAGGDIALEKATVVEGKGEIILESGTYRLLTRTPGQTHLKLTFVAPPPKQWPEGQGLVLLTHAATINRILIEPGPAQEAGTAGNRIGIRSGAVPISSTSEEASTYHITPRTRPAHDPTRIVFEVEDPLLVAEEPPEASLWRLAGDIFACLDGTTLECLGQMTCDTEGGNPSSATFVFPSNVGRIHLEPQEVDSWKTRRNPDGTQSVFVHWKDQGARNHRLSIHYTVPQEPGAKALKLIVPALALQNQDDSPTPIRIFIAPQDGLELGNRTAADNAAPSPPSWIRERLDGQTPYALVAETAETTLPIRWIPRIETAQATVAEASFVSRLVIDGAMLTECHFKIAHNTPQEFQLDLPTGHQVLGCTVSGKQMSPLRRSPTLLGIPLPPPAVENSSDVTLSYTQKIDALDPVEGNVSLTLPQIPWFIHQLDWSLDFPQPLETEAVEGNVQLGPAAGHGNRDDNPSSPGTVRLHKKLCSGDRPSAEIYYRRRQLDR